VSSVNSGHAGVHALLISEAPSAIFNRAAWQKGTPCPQRALDAVKTFTVAAVAERAAAVIVPAILARFS
jgi:hypothetical protein